MFPSKGKRLNDDNISTTSPVGRKLKYKAGNVFFATFVSLQSSLTLSKQLKREKENGFGQSGCPCEAIEQEVRPFSNLIFALDFKLFVALVKLTTISVL